MYFLVVALVIGLIDYKKSNFIYTQMYIYICIYIYVCVCMCLCVCMYVDLYIYICVCVYVFIYFIAPMIVQRYFKFVTTAIGRGIYIYTYE